MNTSLVRKEVREFRERNGFDRAEEHAFAPWYLHQAFQVPENRAIQCSSDGSNDFGVDGFNIKDESRAALVLVQAKFSESLAEIAKGFRDFERALPELKRSVEGIETDEYVQNRVIVNLRAALNRLSGAERKGLEIEFQVLHLSMEDEEILVHKLKEPMNKLQEAISIELENTKCRIRQVGPADLGPHERVVTPPEEIPIRLAGAHTFEAAGVGRMISGIGRLADLVELYNHRRDDLFARNVRYYLTAKKNTEKGPAGKMRATLKEMCIESKSEPEQFAMFHNGVTIVSRKAVVTEKGVALRDPFVLNGCQTIKNAYLFRGDKAFRDRIKADRWERVQLPIRIIETTNDELVRVVTVHNNRQNAMTPAALRSNDAVQIRLEQRFKDRKILYQRQEGAYDHIWSTRPELLEDEYENTQSSWVDIQDLARAIAATMGKIAWAQKPNDLFETDKAYETCFNENKSLASITFLTFLQNLHNVIGVVLKKDLNLNPRDGGPRPSKFAYQCICLAARHLARVKDAEFVSQWGNRIYDRERDFREAVRALLNSRDSGIRSAVARHVMMLESGDAESINGAFDKCQKELHLKENIDPFEVFADLDASTPIAA